MRRVDPSQEIFNFLADGDRTLREIYTLRLPISDIKSAIAGLLRDGAAYKIKGKDSDTYSIREPLYKERPRKKEVLPPLPELPELVLSWMGYTPRHALPPKEYIKFVPEK